MNICEAHRYHWPKPMLYEHHHVIPRAWQKLWRPEVVEFSTPGMELWDERTVPLCPTGHSNVHRILVVAMRGLSVGDDISILGTPRTREGKIAFESMTRFLAFGGSLQFLRSKRAFGFGASLHGS